MPKSRKRKGKSHKQVIPVEVKVPVGTKEVKLEDGKVKNETVYAKVKSNQTKTVKHLPQKK